jgi:hypothetical protein
MNLAELLRREVRMIVLVLGEQLTWRERERGRR